MEDYEKSIFDNNLVTGHPPRYWKISRQKFISDEFLLHLHQDARIKSMHKTLIFNCVEFNSMFNTENYAWSGILIHDYRSKSPKLASYEYWTKRDSILDAYKKEVKKCEMAWRLKQQKKLPNINLNFKIEL